MTPLKRLEAILLQERSLKELLILASSIGLLFIICQFKPSFILGYSDHWKYGVEDFQQHLIGYRYFIQEKWHFPIFEINNYRYPIGTNIIYTDSIPALAIFGKLFRILLPKNFHPFGLWFTFCFIAQAVCLTLIVFKLGQKNYLATLAVSIFGIFSPILLDRYRHISLCSHFIILLALYLYLELRDRKDIHKWKWLFFSLVLFSLFIHIFLFLITFGVFLAALFQNYNNHPETAKEPLGFILLSIFILAGIMFFTGHIGWGHIYRIGEGFGIYSMNLLSPFLPMDGSLFLKTPIIDPSHGQRAEGYNYLGLGLILLLVFNLVFCRKHIRVIYKKNTYLFWIALLFIILAISNKIYFLNFRVLDIPISYPIFNFIHQFRSSGRFYWLAHYIILISLVLLALRYAPQKYKVWVLVIAAFIQFLDTIPLQARLRNATRWNEKEIENTPFLNKARSKEWENAITKHQFLEIYPTWFCHQDDQYRWLNVSFQALAAKHNIPQNSAYIARMHTDCEKEKQYVEQLSPNKKAMYLFIGPQYNLEKVKKRLPGFTCHVDKDVFACSTSPEVFRE